MSNSGLEKREKLLACFEGIDDDIVAEAAEAIGATKKSRPYWLSWGNVAAVLIGAVAVSCVVILAFLLGSSGIGEVPADNGDGYYEGSQVEETPAQETPVPIDLIENGDLLPLPRVHESQFLAILEDGRSHMTVNNPWLYHENARQIDNLPVFRHHTAVINGELTEDDSDAIRRNINYFKNRLMAIASGFPVLDLDDVDPQEFMDLWPEGLTAFLHWSEPSLFVRLTLPESIMVLPIGAGLGHGVTDEEIQVAIEYLAEFFTVANSMEVPTLAQAEHSLDMGGPRIYTRHRYFDSGGSILDAILAFNFEWVEVFTFEPEHTQWVWMYMSTFPQGRFESLQLGNFPIITSEEAREMLLQGYFISERTDAEWPGREAALASSVELVYRNAMDSEIVMPFYRFLIETDLPIWAADQPGEWRAYARYYVPAVHRDYLEPIARRAMPEPDAPPTGSRALPPHIFRAIQGEWWAPLRVPRHQVEELWQEVMDDIGELGVDEAYQFRTACGNYALITGARTLIGIEELRRYYPHLDLPENVGDFTLREVFVNDRSGNMIISYRPMSPLEQIFHGLGLSEENPPPVGEIFTRDLSIEDTSIASAFYAVYENSEGVQVSLGVSALFFDLSSGLPDGSGFLDMGEYGEIHFPGDSEIYYAAMYQPTDPWMGFAVELWFLGGSVSDRINYLDLRYSYDRISHLFIPVPREDLEELVRLFNPAALALEYQWDLMPWQ
ncbi:MAG: hypothetical protein FWE11_07215 [Defluviitaleaceae bacterium]|nr:hypothetical protein [Defluviitaleaceae bacterium]